MVAVREGLDDGGHRLPLIDRHHPLVSLEESAHPLQRLLSEFIRLRHPLGRLLAAGGTWDLPPGSRPAGGRWPAVP